MNPAEWFDFMAEHKEHVVKQIRTHLPDVDFTSIVTGLPPVVYLQEKHGTVELTFEAVQLNLDNKGNVNKVKIFNPSP